jgi:hypothetical protein
LAIWAYPPPRGLTQPGVRGQLMSEAVRCRPPKMGGWVSTTGPRHECRAVPNARIGSGRAHRRHLHARRESWRSTPCRTASGTQLRSARMPDVETHGSTSRIIEPALCLCGATLASSTHQTFSRRSRHGCAETGSSLRCRVAALPPRSSSDRELCLFRCCRVEIDDLDRFDVVAFA